MEKQQERKLIFHSNKYIIVVFLLLEICIYSLFMYMDITNKAFYFISSYLKFAGIILCWIYTWNGDLEMKYNKDKSILRVALFFTVISDLFLLILDYYLLGVITFCIVQLLYLVRISLWCTPDNLIASIKIKAIRNGLTSALIIAFLFFMGLKLNWLMLISVFYFTGILFNTIDGVFMTYHTHTRKYIIFAIGMILFLCCDINVGIFNMLNLSIVEGTFNSKIYEFASIAMWMFYLPAQTAIALSGNF